MGGNALKNVYTRRYNRTEFYELKNEIFNYLINDNLILILCQAYYKKQDFGDMDILFCMNEPLDFSYIIEKLKPDEVVKNDNVYSLNYKDFQIDFINIKQENIETAKLFYFYNDLGLLLGRLAKIIGLTFGPDGLWLKYNYKNKNYKFLLTKDVIKICEILDVSYERWLKGFQTLFDVFEYISTSKYFSQEIINPKFHNSALTRRDNLRTNFILFTAWAQENKDKFKNFNRYTFDDALIFCDNNFSEINLHEKIEYIKNKNIVNEKVKNKFNGRIIIDILNIEESKIIGKVIEKIKGEFKNTDEFNDFIINSCNKEIEKLILEKYNEICLNEIKLKENLSKK